MIFLYYNFLYRIAITIAIFLLLKCLHMDSLFLLVVMLFILDEIDCRFNPISVNCASYLYEKGDKVTDIFVYCLFLLFFRDKFDSFTQKLLIFFILFRFIGVYKFCVTGKNSYLMMFPDFVNSTIYAYAIYYYLGLQTRDYYLLIVLGMVIKMIFEHYMHIRNYV